MKYAKSLAYGGELIDALECEHADFKRLVPLCPNCSNPVHLRIGGDRLSAKGNPYKIGPHFAHFAGKSAEEVADCELRVNGYSQADRERIQRVARGQREKWVGEWFDLCWPKSKWLLDHAGLNGFEMNFSGHFPKEPPEVLLKEHERILADSGLESNQYSVSWHKFKKGLLQMSVDYVWETIERFTYSREAIKGDGGEGPYFPLFPFHDLEIAFVAFGFLRADTQKTGTLAAECFQAMYKMNLQDCTDAWVWSKTPEEINRTQNTYQNALDCFTSRELVALLAQTPWTAEFARLEAEQAARAGKKCAA